MRNSLHISILLFLLSPISTQLSAHELRPGYLELKQTGYEEYNVLWKVPAKGELRLGLYVKLPDNCKNISNPYAYQASGAYIEKWTTACEGGLTGNEIYVEGLTSTFTDVLARIERTDGSSQAARLTPSSPSFVVESEPGSFQVVKTYLVLGVEHILLGIDHLLFVLALLLIVKGWKRLIGTITAFTIAHSITLAAATLGLVNVPGKPVEAIIALSIVFVAAEILHGMNGRSGLAERMPWLIAFIFGLLHGLGFAGALSEVGLPRTSIPLALLFFNVGVELGQLLFVAVMICIYFAFKSVLGILKSRQTVLTGIMRIERGVAYLIGSVACYWVIERIYSFWI